jgi:metal-responsive CopG/Arc/MetJ family transcriptional regulator
MRRNKQTINISIDPEVVSRIDAYVEKFQHLSRSSFIEYVCRISIDALYDLRGFYGDKKSTRKKVDILE